MPPLIDGVGVYRHLRGEDYYPLPYLSASAIRGCRSNTRKLHESLTKQEQKTTEALEFGKAFHSWCLEPQTFLAEYEIIPPGMKFSTKEGKALKAQIEATGKRPIKQEKVDQIKAMQASLMTHPWLRRHFDITKADIELSVVSDIEGVRIKSRLDSYFPDLDGGTSIDLKTTLDACPMNWHKAIRFEGYRLQAAIYLNQLREHGLPGKRFVFAAVEKDPPYICGCYEISEADIQAGWEEVKDLLQRYNYDLKHGWSHYNTEPEMFTYQKVEVAV